MQDEANSPQAFQDGTRLQMQSADLLRRSAELRQRTALARRRFEAAQRRVAEAKKRAELVRRARLFADADG